MCHFTYWGVFGGFNEQNLDHYHQRSLLISLVQQLDIVENSMIQSLNDQAPVSLTRELKDEPEKIKAG